MFYEFNFTFKNMCIPTLVNECNLKQESAATTLVLYSGTALRAWWQ
jgi:hypothetical protein